jgi:hypothetical protein
MELRAAEISSILKKKIVNFNAETEFAEVGQVLEVGDGIARVYGLEHIQSEKWLNSPWHPGNGAKRKPIMWVLDFGMIEIFGRRKQKAGEHCGCAVGEGIVGSRRRSQTH